LEWEVVAKHSEDRRYLSGEWPTGAKVPVGLFCFTYKNIGIFLFASSYFFDEYVQTTALFTVVIA